eukprot:GHVS01055183.1.p1 GENE.GHVS01055183.1~~GHVS01055183.1.p1  ORF type:complete len:130 (-),score=19.56 GHVS01055183.1:89-478(-)
MCCLCLSQLQYTTHTLQQTHIRQTHTTTTHHPHVTQTHYVRLSFSLGCCCCASGRSTCVCVSYLCVHLCLLTAGSVRTVALTSSYKPYKPMRSIICLLLLFTRLYTFYTKLLTDSSSSKMVVLVFTQHM